MAEGVALRLLTQLPYLSVWLRDIFIPLFLSRAVELFRAA